MPNVKVYNMKGQETGAMDLGALFEIEYNEPLIHQAVVTRLANMRQGTKGTLTRTEVRGGGRKPWRQKGTGNARQGSIRAPQWIKGGVVFAPKPRDYRLSVNKKVKRIAMKSALTSKVNDNEIIVYNALDIENPKTKEMVKVLNAMNVGKALIVLSDKDEIVERAARNIPGVKTTLVSTLNVYEILKYNTLILTKDSVAKIEEVYA